MDMPPSGWYPDPYGVPDLLRWWDGSAWTQHTHSGSAPEPSDAKEPPTSLDATRIGDAPGPGMAGMAGAAGAAALRPTTVQPSAMQPPVPTQPATVRPPGAPLADAQPTATLAGQPTATLAGQPTATLAGQPPTPWQPGADANSPADNGGTRVLFMDESAWTSPNGPGSPGHGLRHGRRLFLGGLLAGGTAAALALVALAVTHLGSGHAPQTAAQTPAAAATQPTQTAAPSPSPSASPSASVTPGGVTDTQTGVSYGLASAPWGNNGCPQILNSPQILTWTAGESALAGQVSVNGTHPWYGEACSGPLPQGYNYAGVADLEPAAMNVVQSLQQNYYSLLNAQFAQQLSQPVSISGHPGWEIEYQLTYPNAASEGLTFTTELGEVILTDEGNGAQPAVFLVSVPGNLGTGLVASLASSLTLANQPTTGAGSPTA